MCQSRTWGAGRWQRIASTVHRIARSVRRAPLPVPVPVPSLPVHFIPGTRGRRCCQNPQQPPVSPSVPPPFPVGEDPCPVASPGSRRAQPHARWHRRTQSFHHAGLGAGRGLRRSRPPAAAARCLLLSCPMRQPPGLGYRAVSNFVPVPRHQGRGTWFVIYEDTHRAVTFKAGVEKLASSPSKEKVWPHPEIMVANMVTGQRALT